MAEQRDLLVEIGTEELPPKALDSLSKAFHDSFTAALQQRTLGFASIRRFASPRRLALLVSGLDLAQADRQVERKGPTTGKASLPRRPRASLGPAASR